MELNAIECRRCGAAIKYAPGATHLKCDFCGTEYQLNRGAERDGGARDIDYLGRGTLFKAYVPDGWDCRVFDDDQSFSRLAAVCKGLRLDSPGGERLLFYPFAYYKGYGRSVEADVRYERLFQKGGDYAGSTSAGVDPGAGWQELKRRD